MTCSGFLRSRRPSATAGCAVLRRVPANTVQRTPLSKQRNKHLQTTLIEAAKMAPRYSPTLALLYDKEKQKGNANRATLAVARKLVAYLMAVDRGQRNFQVAGREITAPLRKARRRTRRISSTRGLPGLAVNPTGRRSASSAMLPLISFETGRKTQTQSSGRPKRLRQQMEVWFFCHE